MSAGDAGREAFAAFLLRLRAKGITSKDLVAAFETTPRRDFVPAAWRDAAWSDRMIPIECGEAIEGADLQAAVIDSLAIEPGNRVLEVGTGTGYSAAVMARLAGRVSTVERYRTLVELARQRFEALSIPNVSVRQADGSNGLPGEGPFERIVVWTAFETLPRSFTDQLASGGVMIAVVGPPEDRQVLTRLTKVGSRFDRIDLGHVRLQPTIPGVAAKL